MLFNENHMENSLRQFIKARSEKECREAPLDLNIDTLTDKGFDTTEVLTLCRNLIAEESSELLDELQFMIDCDVDCDPAKVLKELADTIYVLYYLVASFGLPIDVAFNRVHDNNMLKIANGTIRDDGKLVKHPDHPKVNLKDLFNEVL
jgi:NTP pyrophosphatase (non-canonical NTP hydrolase)